MNVEDVYLPISDKKQSEFSGRMFGINRPRFKDKITVNQQAVYEAFALYFNWALNIENPQESEKALKEGEFALQDMQTPDKALVVKVDTKPKTSEAKYYEDLPDRVNRIDTVEIRRRVFGKIIYLLDDSRPIRNSVE